MADFMKNYRARVVKEGVLKSLFWALIIGCGALTLCTLISWFFGFGAGLYIGIALLVVCTAAATPIIYFLKYRPTTKTVAKRIDELGLEERVLTMTELEGDDSYIAQMQRRDTERALRSVDHLLLKIAVSVSLVVAVCAVGFVGAGATTVNALYNAGVIPSGMELVDQNRTIDEYSVTFSVQEGTGGKLYLWDDSWETPTAVQAEPYIVKAGGSTPAVYAEDGFAWTFAGWSDGVMSRYRKVEDVQSNLNLVALFVRASEDQPPIDDVIMTDFPDSSDNAPPNNMPNPDNPNPNIKPEDSDDIDDGSGGHDGGGNRDEANQQIVDGQTYYGDSYADAHQNALDRLGSGEDNMPDDLKDRISDYYDSIEKNGSGNSDEGSGEGENP